LTKDNIDKIDFNGSNKLYFNTLLDENGNPLEISIEDTYYRGNFSVIKWFPKNANDEGGY